MHAQRVNSRSRTVGHHAAQKVSGQSAHDSAIRTGHWRIVLCTLVDLPGRGEVCNMLIKASGYDGQRKPYGNVDLGSRRVEDHDFAGRTGIVVWRATLVVLLAE